MRKVGDRIYHTGHGSGTVVALNKTRPNNYVSENLLSPQVREAVAVGLGPAIFASAYDGERFPYVVQFDSGYKDVYAETDLENPLTAGSK